MRPTLYTFPGMAAVVCSRVVCLEGESSECTRLITGVGVVTGQDRTGQDRKLAIWPWRLETAGSVARGETGSTWPAYLGFILEGGKNYNCLPSWHHGNCSPHETCKRQV